MFSFVRSFHKHHGGRVFDKDFWVDLALRRSVTPRLSLVHFCPQLAVPTHAIVVSEYQASSVQADACNFAVVDLNATMHYKVLCVTPGCIRLYHGLG